MVKHSELKTFSRKVLIDMALPLWKLSFREWRDDSAVKKTYTKSKINRSKKGGQF